MKQSLASFIAEVGDEKAADLFGVKLRTVESWRRGERTPRPKQAQQIIAAADGRLDFQSIYGSKTSEAA